MSSISVKNKHLHSNQIQTQQMHSNQEQSSTIPSQSHQFQFSSNNDKAPMPRHPNYLNDLKIDSVSKVHSLVKQVIINLIKF